MNLHQPTKPNPPDVSRGNSVKVSVSQHAGWCKLFSLVVLAVTLCVGCGTARLEPGGVYAPTNAVGQIIYNELPLAVADASYKLAFQSILLPMKFERDNRAALHVLNPNLGWAVKTKMDSLRLQVQDVDKRWAVARAAYKANPTPAGMSTLQTALAEISRLLPVVQGQIVPMQQALITRNQTP